MIWVILFGVVVLILVVVLLYLLFCKSAKSKEKPKTLTETPKTENTSETVEPKEDKTGDTLPEILKEVTMGNYLHDMCEDEGNPLEFSMEENPNIKRSDMSFKPVQLDGEMEDEPLTTKDIIDQLDGDDTTSLSKQIKQLTPEMKAILISNLLNKKDRF